MAKRFIDKDKLIEHLEDNVRECGNPDVATEPITYGCSLGLKGALSYARTLPTADVVEVRHGRWIKHKPDSEYIKGLHQLGIAKGMGENSIYWTCSECEHWGVIHYKYCPNCGAKMDGEGRR